MLVLQRRPHYSDRNCIQLVISVGSSRSVRIIDVVIL